jgi:hypothetical protein
MVDDHRLMLEAKRVYGWVERHFWQRDSFISSSNGVPSSSRPILTDKNGKLDNSFLDVSELIADTVGAMVSGNTETLIAVTYQDTDNTLDFVLDSSVPTFSIGTWTPVVADLASGGNIATTNVAYGEYIKIDTRVWLSCRLTQINTTGMTAGNAVMVRGFPFPSSNLDSSYRATATASLSNITFGGYVSINMLSNASSVTIVNNASGAAAANILVSALTSGTALIQFSMTYKTQ